jgi:hypothetical protein
VVFSVGGDGDRRSPELISAREIDLRRKGGRRCPPF